MFYPDVYPQSFYNYDESLLNLHVRACRDSISRSQKLPPYCVSRTTVATAYSSACEMDTCARTSSAMDGLPSLSFTHLMSLNATIFPMPLPSALEYASLTAKPTAKNSVLLVSLFIILYFSSSSSLRILPD